VQRPFVLFTLVIENGVQVPGITTFTRGTHVTPPFAQQLIHMVFPPGHAAPAGSYTYGEPVPSCVPPIESVHQLVFAGVPHELVSVVVKFSTPAAQVRTMGPIVGGFCTLVGHGVMLIVNGKVCEATLYELQQPVAPSDVPNNVNVSVDAVSVLLQNVRLYEIENVVLQASVGSP
jgi:hypothetical protein